MTRITRELLIGYLEDALSDAETARIEQEIRQSAVLQKTLRNLMQEQDRGEHSLGAIWQRNRLTCVSREELGSYVLKVLDQQAHDYVEFHLQTVGCSFCRANLKDLEAQHQEPSPKAQERRRKYFESSAGYLRPKS